jgi:hypothetical protein
MAKRQKPGKYKKGKKKAVEVKTYEYNDYIEEIKNLKKYAESVDYLRLFNDSINDESGESSVWKFKSNLQTFIKKHILLKDIFGKEAFTYFQHYFSKMAGKEEFLKTCQDIVEKINTQNIGGLYDQLLIYNVKPLSKEDSDKFFDKLLKRCVILIENN